MVPHDTKTTVRNQWQGAAEVWLGPNRLFGCHHLWGRSLEGFGHDLAGQELHLAGESRWQRSHGLFGGHKFSNGKRGRFSGMEKTNFKMTNKSGKIQISMKILQKSRKHRCKIDASFFLCSAHAGHRCEAGR